MSTGDPPTGRPLDLSNTPSPPTPGEIRAMFDRAREQLTNPTPRGPLAGAYLSAEALEDVRLAGLGLPSIQSEGGELPRDLAGRPFVNASFEAGMRLAETSAMRRLENLARDLAFSEQTTNIFGQRGFDDLIWTCSCEANGEGDMSLFLLNSIEHHLMQGHTIQLRSTSARTGEGNPGVTVG